MRFALQTTSGAQRRRRGHTCRESRDADSRTLLTTSVRERSAVRAQPKRSRLRSSSMSRRLNWLQIGRRREQANGRDVIQVKDVPDLIAEINCATIE